MKRFCLSLAVLGLFGPVRSLTAQPMADARPLSGSGETVNLLSGTEAPGGDLVKVYVRKDATSQARQQEPKPAVRFAVQLSATSRPIADSSPFKSWESVGPVFIHQEDGLYKVRIGPFATQQEAKAALLRVKEKGKADAFIVVQAGREENQRTERHAPPQGPSASAIPNTGQPAPASSADETFEADPSAEYKVRLASYLKPGGFNTRDIEQYGQFETYRQGEWTIMLIGGLKTLEEARRVREAVSKKGFPDARVVIDRGGILEDAPGN